jgi:hypothetical protein
MKVFNDDNFKSGQFLFRDCEHVRSLWICEHCVKVEIERLKKEIADLKIKLGYVNA